ncbi:MULTISPECIES: NAD-dependent epimerase/dehydratase family protein [Clostridium]|uniref:NAD-dependent epimerase/dehydratase family protein n=1 Tax=Clostridium TaxID=1485 RepID=UPI00082522D6|nr:MULTISPECIES: NAD(P)-dependent oxidoreductase [Clostridium]PJI06515.1 NAD(P)-dependent oxidoreductase [Clostridium sp. CT7]
MILITGCTGYIGKRLTSAMLKRGFKVRGLVPKSELNKAKPLVNKGMELWKGDLFDSNTLHGIGKNVKVVYHLAGLHSSVEKMNKLYVEGTKSLVNQLNNSSIEEFYFSSSGAVYGDYGDKLLTENYPPEPIHPFGVISANVEKFLLQLFNEKRFPCIIFRIGEVYGPGEYNPLKKASYSGLRGLGNGLNYTSKIHIEDLISILTTSPKKLKVGKIYNLVDDIPVLQKDFYNEIVKISGCPSPIWIPKDTVPERIKLSIHGLRMLSIRMSNASIKKNLNYKFIFPSYHEGLNNLIENK